MSEDIITDEWSSDSDSIEDGEVLEENILCECGNPVIETKTYCLKCIPQLCKMCEVVVADEYCVECYKCVTENSNICVICNELTMDLCDDVCSKCKGTFESVSKCIICKNDTLNFKDMCEKCEYENLMSIRCSRCSMHKEHKTNHSICVECEKIMCYKCRIREKVKKENNCINCILLEAKIGFAEICCKDKNQKCGICIKICDFNDFIENKILNNFSSLYFDVGLESKNESKWRYIKRDLDFSRKLKCNKMTKSEVQRDIIKDLNIDNAKNIPEGFTMRKLVNNNDVVYKMISRYINKNIDIYEFFRSFKHFFSTKTNDEILNDYIDCGWNDISFLNVCYKDNLFQTTYEPFNAQFDIPRCKYMLGLRKICDKNLFMGHYMSFLFKLGANIIIEYFTWNTMIFLMIIKRLKIKIPNPILCKIFIGSTSIINFKYEKSF